MSTKLDWTKLTDAEKNACFAELVAGWKPDPFNNGQLVKSNYRPVKGQYSTAKVPDYLHSADAVLPWLETAYQQSCIADHSFSVEISWQPPHKRNCPGYEWAYDVEIFPAHAGVVNGTASTLAEAAMIALLRAKGVEVIT